MSDEPPRKKQRTTMTTDQDDDLDVSTMASGTTTTTMTTTTPKKKKNKNKRTKENIRAKRIRKELEKLQKDPPFGVWADLESKDNISKWIGRVSGPPDTPYEGGTFRVTIVFPDRYPHKPPSVKFVTKVYHCNVSGSNICLDVIKDKWSPALTASTVLLSIGALLASPNEKDPLNSEVARLYISDQEAHNTKAREWTKKYAL
jgi:ubiquitin-protein ligase